MQPAERLHPRDATALLCAAIYACSRVHGSRAARSRLGRSTSPPPRATPAPATSAAAAAPSSAAGTSSVLAPAPLTNPGYTGRWADLEEEDDEDA